MRRSFRRGVVGVFAALAVLVTMAGVAWPCVGLVAFRVEGSSTVEPGSNVKMFGGEFAKGKPVDIHLDGPDGPVLATVEDPQPSTMTSRFTLDVPIPEDISSGTHILVATQDHFDMNAGIPARAAIQVGTSEPVAVDLPNRPTALGVSSGPGTASLVMTGLAAAAGGLLLAAGWNLFASRRALGHEQNAEAS